MTCCSSASLLIIDTTASYLLFIYLFFFTKRQEQLPAADFDGFSLNIQRRCRCARSDRSPSTFPTEQRDAAVRLGQLCFQEFPSRLALRQLLSQVVQLRGEAALFHGDTGTLVLLEHRTQVKARHGKEPAELVTHRLQG